MLNGSLSVKLQFAVFAALCSGPFVQAEEERAGPDWWAWQPVRAVEVPDSSQNHVIDAFVAAKLEDHGLELSKMASPRVQMRRL